MALSNPVPRSSPLWLGIVVEQVPQAHAHVRALLANLNATERPEDLEKVSRRHERVWASRCETVK